MKSKKKGILRAARRFKKALPRQPKRKAIAIQESAIPTSTHEGAPGLKIRGQVSMEGGEFPVAGVTVVALVQGEMGRKGENPSLRLPIGRAATDIDGAFTIETDSHDPLISRWACLLRSCSEFKFRLVCMDRDETVLHETEPLAYREEFPVEIALREPPFAARRKDWQQLSRQLRQGQMGRLGDLAAELATLAPRGLFRDWSVTRRLGVLGHLEQALLDPEGRLARAGVPIRFARFASDASLLSLREEVQRLDRRELLPVLDQTVARARAFGGFAEINSFISPDAFQRGDVIGGVNEFIKPGLVVVPGLFPWMKSPLIGYRDYLRDRWCDHQRFEHVLGGGDQEVATAATMIQRLNHRFHQDFATQDLTDQPANRVLWRILHKILGAPTGAGYGFGLTTAPEPQGDRTHREYLDFLIAKTGLSLEEIGKRYRLNLQRSDLERSNPVQQNIDTLQRFFTDSYQSVDDPYAVLPDRKPGTAERLISKFPPEAAGPFFLEYEEWLEREAPFYPENHYDPRATYHWTLWERLQKTRDAIFANSIPLGEFLDIPKSKALKFIPESGGYDHRAAKWQWVRNHVEVWELVVAANNEAKSLQYVGAEEKYKLALSWVTKLRDFVLGKEAWWQYDAAAFAKDEKKADVSSLEKLAQFEARQHRHFGQHYDSSLGTVTSDLLPGGGEISEHWWGKDEAPFYWHGNKREIRYLLDYLQFRYLPLCLSEVQLALGKYADAVRQLVGREGIYSQAYRWFAGPAGFNVFIAKPSAGGALPIGGRLKHYTDGLLPYATSSERTEYPPPAPPTSVPTNRAELGYGRLKLGHTVLEWADVLYRSNQPESIMRARELYKGVIFLHGEDPEITPTWDRRQDLLPIFPWQTSAGNPAVVSQVSRARLGFLQINAGLNYYGISPAHVPPVRFRVLKEAADRFAAGARGAQGDFLNYTQQLDQLTVHEMTARTMVAKANAALSIAQEQQKIAEFNVGEAQKQVDGINAQIAAKQAEIAKKDEFFEQFKDFAGGMKDSISNLGKMAFAGDGEPAAASAGQLSTGDILSLGFKVGTATNVLGGATSALSGAAGVAGPFGAFLYAGVTSMTSLADAVAKRAGELAHLQNVALPAAKALVVLKKRDVTIAQLAQTIAKADWQLGKDLLTFYAQRFLNRSFLVAMSDFSNRLMRRYLDLAGRMAWLAERALAFEQDRPLSIIAFDYFPRNLRGVSGADLLQLHLAELEAARIQGLTQTIPVKHTVSLARDFPVPFGQLKKTGFCRFVTSEAPLRLVHPGVYGYRVRNVTVAASYAAPVPPHRGLFSNQGVSLVTRDQSGSEHPLIRYPDALPLSEFRLRDDMWVFDLPDETLLPFEGSGIETTWELMLSKVGNAHGFDTMTDLLVTFDMRASYSALLEKEHLAALPATANRSLLASGKTLNPGAIAKFRQNGGKLTLAFDLSKLAHNANETARKTLNFLLVAVGVADAPFTATFSSAKPVQQATITFERGLALSNAGALADGNGGVPLPLHAFTGKNADQTFKLVLESAANPGVDFKQLEEILLLVEYEAKF